MTEPATPRTGMFGRYHAGTFVAGVLTTAAALALLAEGLGAWDLDRAGLPYAFPALLILLGTIGVAGGLGHDRR